MTANTPRDANIYVYLRRIISFYVDGALLLMPFDAATAKRAANTPMLYFRLLIIAEQRLCYVVTAHFIVTLITLRAYAALIICANMPRCRQRHLRFAISLYAEFSCRYSMPLREFSSRYYAAAPFEIIFRRRYAAPRALFHSLTPPFTSH